MATTDFTIDQRVAVAHREAVTTPLSEIAGNLQSLISRRLTAYIAGVKDGKTVSRWASGETGDIRHESQSRLLAAYEIVTLLTHYDSPEVAKKWLVGLNPQLDDVSPAEAIHEGKLRDALAAARAFVAFG
jgi:hypothetical protein